MFHFAERGHHRYISNNAKVMVSTMRAQQGFVETDGLAIPGGAPHYLIVRDPYARLVSFYRDKFDVYMQQPRQIHQYFDCYKVFFAPLGIRERDPIRVARAALAAMTFPQLVSLLEEDNVTDDVHLMPQANEAWDFDQVLKMDDPDDLETLSCLIDLAVHERDTGSYDVDDYYSPALRRIVQRVYRDDFETFDYSTAARRRLAA